MLIGELELVAPLLSMRLFRFGNTSSFCSLGGFLRQTCRLLVFLFWDILDDLNSKGVGKQVGNPCMEDLALTRRGSHWGDGEEIDGLSFSNSKNDGAVLAEPCFFARMPCLSWLQFQH